MANITLTPDQASALVDYVEVSNAIAEKAASIINNGNAKKFAAANVKLLVESGLIDEDMTKRATDLHMTHEGTLGLLTQMTAKLAEFKRAEKEAAAAKPAKARLGEAMAPSNPRGNEKTAEERRAEFRTPNPGSFHSRITGGKSIGRTEADDALAEALGYKRS